MGKIGRYEVIRVLHQGRSGEVILAQDENLGRRVAIKRPFRSAVASGIARFRVEAKAATLRHPNIPTVYEMGAQDDLPFLAMEYVEGDTLEAILQGGRELDLMTRLRIIEQVCSALGCAHKNGIVHRDIKPANIIVRPDGTTKVIDFGHARLEDDEPGFVTAGQAATSQRYIAPECFHEGKADGRADIFSAGATLFRLLTGEEPAGVDGAHARLRPHLRDYPPALEGIVEKSMAANPADRYQAAEDFADALRDVIAGLRRGRVAELFKEAERLHATGEDTPALKVLDEAIRLDPAHPKARGLRKAVREHQERMRREERQRGYLLKSEEAFRSGNFDEALGKLKDALALDPSSAEVKGRIHAVEARKRRSENSLRALAEAEDVKLHGDAGGALEILTRALEQDPENPKLAESHAALHRRITIEAQRGRFMDLHEGASRALAMRNYDDAEKLLDEAASIDPSDRDIETLRRELAKAREMEQHVAQLEEVRLRVQELMREDEYERAADLVHRAVEKMPNELLLHRLKAEVDAQAGLYDVRSIVDLAISRANEMFASSPFEALAMLEKASEAIPGDERLIACERTLRGQLEGRRPGQLRDDAVRRARELIDARQADKAVGVLESFQGKFGPHAEIDGLLTVARGEIARRRA